MWGNMQRKSLGLLDARWTLLLAACIFLQAWPSRATPPSAVISAAADAIVGLWETYDDDTHLLTSLVRIVRVIDRADKAGDQGGWHYEGFIDRIFPQANEDPHPRCTKCTDGRKNQPVLGMRIINHLRLSSPDHYDGGDILDPDNGEIYRLRVAVRERNTRLDVRGYIGISLFGRSQIWRRVVATIPSQTVPSDMNAPIAPNAPNAPNAMPGASPVLGAVPKAAEKPR